MSDKKAGLLFGDFINQSSNDGPKRWFNKVHGNKGKAFTGWGTVEQRRVMKECVRKWCTLVMSDAKVDWTPRAVSEATTAGQSVGPWTSCLTDDNMSAEALPLMLTDDRGNADAGMMHEVRMSYRNL
jgi:hypothetical protein